MRLSKQVPTSNPAGHRCPQPIRTPTAPDRTAPRRPNQTGAAPRPPPMDQEHPYKNKINSNILSESLEDTVKRVVPYYEKKIKPLPMITNQFDLKECDKALKLFDKQSASVGKIIINCIIND